MNEVKFYYCEACGNLVILLNEGPGQLVCCGQDMILLEAGTTDAAKEKHVPEAKREGDRLIVQVGSVAHPMEEKHYITHIVAVQGDKVQIKYLKPGEEPKAEFAICAECEDKIQVYEFCNLHGLWMTEV